MPESMGILHPGTSFGVFWSTNVARTWYRNEKYPLIPEKPGIRRGIPREGDKPLLVRPRILERVWVDPPISEMGIVGPP